MTNARKTEWIKKMSERLTDEDLVAIDDAARRASPAPWILAITPEEWGPDEIAANQTKMVHEGGKRAHFCIHPEDAEADEARVTAYCGNGPTSEANARFIEIARVAVPMLVSEIRRLRAPRSDASANPTLYHLIRAALIAYVDADDLNAAAHAVVENAENHPDLQPTRAPRSDAEVLAPARRALSPQGDGGTE